MPFWKKLLIDIIFIALYYAIYKFAGFELTVIIALGQIMSNLVQKEYHKKPQLPKQVYMQPKTRMKF